MDLRADLLSHLRELAESTGQDGSRLTRAATKLGVDLRVAVGGYAGFQLTLVRQAHPLTLTAWQAEPGTSAATSIRVALPLLLPSLEAGSRVVFYSARPGSLVDLGADLAYALRRPAPSADEDEDDVLLDADLPPSTTEPGITGLEELSTLDRAAGVMIDRGHDPGTVHETLRAHALAAGLTLQAFAAQLLGR